MELSYFINLPVLENVFLGASHPGWESDPPLNMSFVGAVMLPPTPTNDFPTSRNSFKPRKIAKHIKKSKNFTIDLFWTIEQEKIAKIYFSVYNDYECGNHKVSPELYWRVKWMSYTLSFHTLNHYIHWNIDLILF